ncbi:MAG TPA: antibiotic biosynthesis monooxygenase [Thermoanaerobaculia bacterium]|nr:antibiotic biosynthesis monooxygenase [Thermoanaerobaculia bacterium]
MKFIFEVKVRPGHTAEQYADAWVRASRIIQTAPGARGTRLHRKIGDPTTLIAIASWDSKAARDAADAALGPRLAEVRGIIAEGAEHVEVEILGEFEEPEWVVLPEARA